MLSARDESLERSAWLSCGQPVSRFGRIDFLGNNAASLELTAQDPDVAALDPEILTRTLRATWSRRS